MDTYLVLHIDLEFIAAAICKSNGSYFSVKNQNEELLWLYFFNDPNLNRITYGKANRQHFHNLEVNYFGEFCDKILDENEKFTRNGIQKPVIELLENSGMLRLFTEKFKERAPFALTDTIPTLISFSSTLKELSKKKLIDYLESKNFKVESHSIPFAELTSHYLLKETKLSVNKSKIVLFLEATNSTLHLMKLNYIGGHFFIDKNSIESYNGKGYDPRKKAIINFVVNEVNKSTGLLNKEEIEKECGRFEASAEQWLKRVDATGENSPVNIQGIWLSPAQSIQRNVLVRKEHIEEDTGYFINELINIYRTFEDKQVEKKEAISAVILLGECFSNNLIRDKFTHLLSDKLIITPLSILNEIQAVYPEIDLKKYADEKERDKIIRKAIDESESQKSEALKKERRELEEQEKKREDLANKQIAKEQFEKAKKLHQEGKLDEAVSKAEKAKSLNPSSSEVRIFYDLLIKEKKSNDVKSEKYALYLKEAEVHLSNDELNEALSKYKLAQKIFDAEKIRESIENIYAELEERKSHVESEYNKKLIHGYLEESDRLINSNKLSDALTILDKAAEVNLNEPSLSKKRAEVEALIDIQTVELNQLTAEAEIFLSEGQTDKAEAFCRDALKRKPDDERCLVLLDKITEKRRMQTEKEKSFKQTIELADSLFAKEEYDNAEKSYRKALLIKNEDKHCQIQLSNIAASRIKTEERRKREELKLAEGEKEYRNIIDQASEYIERYEWDKAISSYGRALIIKPDDSHCLKQLSVIDEAIQKEEEKKKTEELIKTENAKVYRNILEQASQSFQSGNWDEAEKLYLNARETVHDDMFVQDQLSQIARKRNEEKEEKNRLNADKVLKKREKKANPEPENPEKPLKPSMGIFAKYKKIFIGIGLSVVAIVVIFFIINLKPTPDKTKSNGHNPPNDTTKVEVHSLVFDYGYYDGASLNGKMDGKGKLTFTESYTCFKGEPDEIKVEKDFYLEGTWRNGEFYRGRLFNSKSKSFKTITRGM